MEKIVFEGWPNCIRLYNREMELIATTDVGPRIIRCGLIGGPNLLYVQEEDRGKTGGAGWRLYGGHRLWHAPEAMPRTYCPDNSPVQSDWDGKTLTLTQDKEATTGIVKEMAITLSPDNNRVILLHRLVNRNLWTIETAPWAITAQAGGGRAILPQEPYIDPAEYLLPARPVVLWHYARMNDPRWTWGDRYIQLIHNPEYTTEQKAGILNKAGWAAYINGDNLMIKHFSYDPLAAYPDYGCNCEVYVNDRFLEIESLGAVGKLEPGQTIEHREEWRLARIESPEVTATESSLDAILKPHLPVMDT